MPDNCSIKKPQPIAKNFFKNYSLAFTLNTMVLWIAKLEKNKTVSAAILERYVFKTKLSFMPRRSKYPVKSKKSQKV